MMGRANRPRSATRSRVCWKVECLPRSGTNCLGMLSRDSGHRRLPEPPTKMTGVIRDMVFFIARPYSPSRHEGQWAGSSLVFGRLAAEILLPPALGLDLDRLGQGGDVGGDFVEVAGVEDQHRRWPGGGHRGGARLALEQRHLAEEGAVAQADRAAVGQ